MGDDNFLIVIGLVLVFPFIFYFLKVWLFATGTPGSTHHRVRRIAEMDGHVSFEERLAEQLRVVGQEIAQPIDTPPPSDPSPPQASAASAPRPVPNGFGRRGL